MRNFCIALLVHEKPKVVSAIIDYFIEDDVPVVVHVDVSAQDMLQQLSNKYESTDLCKIVPSIKCKWGDWSLVEAELSLYKSVVSSFPTVSHVHLMSGADVPLASNDDLEEFFRKKQDTNFIELIPILERKFVVDGPEIERLQYYYPVNFKRFPRLFNFIYKCQVAFTPARKIPNGLIPHMGSQFKSLTLDAIIQLLNFIKENHRVVTFFRSTWIPDESFIPTILAHLQSSGKVSKEREGSLTHRVFNEKGKPVLVYPEHLQQLRDVGHLFVRKYAPNRVFSLDSFDSVGTERNSSQRRHVGFRKAMSVGRPVIAFFSTEFDQNSITRIDDYLGGKPAFCGLIGHDLNFEKKYDHLIAWQNLNITQLEYYIWREFWREASDDYFVNMGQVGVESETYFAMPVSAIQDRDMRWFVMNNASRRILLDSGTLNFECNLLTNFALRHAFDLEILEDER